MSTTLIPLSTDGPSGLDLKPIKRFLGDQLVGQPYLFGRESYAGELVLHFGKLRNYASLRMAGKTRGTHLLSVRASGWSLMSGVRPAMIGCGLVPVNSDMEPKPGKVINPAMLESGAFIGQSAVVSLAEAIEVEGHPTGGIALYLELSDGSKFTIIPTVSELVDGEIADWELLTPDKSLRVGPGHTFNILDAN